MITCRTLQESEIQRELFLHFNRRQVVTDCVRKEQGKWVVKSDPFVDDWSEQDYRTLVSCLRHTAATGGFVSAAFCDNRLKGFVSVEAEFTGSQKNYLDLSSLHVSEDMRGNGIGKELFLQAKEWAREMGAEKLYISAHSAIESQLFYQAMGCVEAMEYNQRHVEEEPYDCQLELSVRRSSKAHARGQNAKQVRALRTTKSHTRESPKTGNSPRGFESQQSCDMWVSVKNQLDS